MYSLNVGLSRRKREGFPGVLTRMGRRLGAFAVWIRTFGWQRFAASRGKERSAQRHEPLKE